MRLDPKNKMGTKASVGGERASPKKWYDGRMITVLIRVSHGPEALVMTLSSLVPAVADGLVGDAVIIAPAHDDATSAVADASGATLVVSDDLSWRHGAGMARKDWILCLDDGDIPQEGWIRVLDRFITLGARDRYLGRLRRSGGIVRRASNAARTLFCASGVRAGDLVHARALLDEVKIRHPVRLSASVERDPAFG